MLRACAARFDVTENHEKFSFWGELNKASALFSSPEIQKVFKILRHIESCGT